MSVFDKKFANKKSNKREHKRAIKVFNEISDETVS